MSTACGGAGTGATVDVPTRHEGAPVPPNGAGARWVPGDLVSDSTTPTPADAARLERAARGLTPHVEDRATLARVAARLVGPGHLDAAEVEGVADAHRRLHPPDRTAEGRDLEAACGMSG